MGEIAGLGAFVEGANGVRAQGAEAHGRNVEYRCIIGSRAIRPADLDAERRSCERPRRHRMAEPFVSFPKDCVPVPQRARIAYPPCTLIDHRAKMGLDKRPFGPPYQVYAEG